MNNMTLPTRIFFAAIMCSIVGVSVHIHLLKLTSAYVATHAPGSTILHVPYPNWIVLASYSSFIFQALGLVIIYRLLGQYLPAKTNLGRGLLFGLIILLLKGELIRQPLMNILVGNSFDVAFVQQSQIWLATLSATIVIALLTPLPRS